MKKLLVSTLIVSGLTITGVSSLALNEQPKDAQTEQHMKEGTEHGAKTQAEFRGVVTNVQDSTVEVKDEAGKTHSFDTTGLQNLEELKVEALKPGDTVRVEMTNGEAILIQKVEAKSEASSEDTSSMAKEDLKDADSMKEDMNKENELSAEGASEDESRMPAEGLERKEQAEIAGEGEYVVKQGDTLAGIAEEQLGSGEDWKVIARANDIENPDIIHVGQRLTIPSNANGGSEDLNPQEAPDSGQTEPVKDSTDKTPENY